MSNQPSATVTNQEDLVFNPGSERNILSICLKDSDKLLDVESQEVHVEHFSVPAYKHIFMAMMYLYSKQIEPTPMSIMEVITSDKAKRDLEKIGGLDHLVLMKETLIPTDNLKIFIDKIKQSYTRKSLFDISTDVREFVLSDKAEVLNPSELVSYAEQRITDLSSNATVDTAVYKMGTDTEQVLEERGSRPAQIPGLEVGWTQFDRITNGGQPGDLIVVCAPSKTGKSVTLTNWATKIGIHDRLPILYFDTEMNEREQEDRILANLTGIPHEEITNGMYVQDTINGKADDKIARLKDARETLGMGNYFHIYLPQFSLEKVQSIARKFQRQLGIVAIFFDYIKIPSNEANFRDQQEYQRLGYFTSGLKELAGMLNIPVYTACQTNRNDTKGSDPSESDIGGSYRILQLASKLMFLYNKTDEEIAKQGFDSGNQKLIIKFQRNGASNCDPIDIMFDKPILRQNEA